MKSFQGKITKCIWNKKGLRVSSRCLFNLPEQGGLGVPNLWWYYQAARLAQLSDVYIKKDRPEWVNIEEQASPAYSLESLLWCIPKRRPSILSPALSQALVLWDSLRNNPSIISKGQPLADIF